MVKLYQYKLPLKSGAYREGLILESNNRYGEIAPLPGFSRETLLEAKKETLDWIHFKTPTTLPSVQFGISSLQKTLSPIHIPLSALGPKRGFSTAKLKLGHLPLSEAISLVKEHYKHFSLRLDCNRAWTLDQAFTFASHFKPSDFLYLEEPVQTFEELIAFSEKTQFPIALDESIRNDWTRIPSLKAIVVKPTLIGSIPQVPPHLDLILSSSYESGIGLLHIAHLANNSLPIGLDTYTSFQEDLLNEPIETANGHFSWHPKQPLSLSPKYLTLLA